MKDSSIHIPMEVVNKIFLFMNSPTVKVFKESKYYRVRFPFRKLYEVSKRPRKCMRHIRHDFYKIYLDAFIQSLGSNRSYVDLANPVFCLPTDEDFDKEEKEE